MYVIGVDRINFYDVISLIPGGPVSCPLRVSFVKEDAEER